MNPLATKVGCVSICLIAIFFLLNSCDSEENQQVPTITSFSPIEVTEGTKVTIKGANFSPERLKNIIKFNNTTATAMAVTPNSIDVRVPAGATTGRITVSVDGQIATSPVDFVMKDCGVIEKYLLANTTGAVVEPINASKYTYASSYATRRGFTFATDKNIRITEIGGMFRKKGSYTLEMFHVYNFTPLYSTTVTVENVGEFVFNDVTTDLVLSPGVEYYLEYCDINHDSVYDVWLPMTGSPDYVQPHDFGDITMNWLFYSYMDDCSNPNYSLGNFKTSYLFMRGIVDFKYEVVE